jgi:hypothetical protein
MQNLINTYVTNWALTTFTSKEILNALCIISFNDYDFAKEMHDNPSNRIIESVKMIVTADGNKSPLNFHWVNCEKWLAICFNEELQYNYY